MFRLEVGFDTEEHQKIYTDAMKARAMEIMTENSEVLIEVYDSRYHFSRGRPNVEYYTVIEFNNIKPVMTFRNRYSSFEGMNTIILLPDDMSPSENDIRTLLSNYININKVKLMYSIRTFITKSKLGEPIKHCNQICIAMTSSDMLDFDLGFIGAPDKTVTAQESIITSLK